MMNMTDVVITRHGIYGAYDVEKRKIPCVDESRRRGVHIPPGDNSGTTRISNKMHTAAKEKETGP